MRYDDARFVTDSKQTMSGMYRPKLPLNAMFTIFLRSFANLFLKTLFAKDNWVCEWE